MKLIPIIALSLAAFIAPLEISYAQETLRVSSTKNNAPTSYLDTKTNEWKGFMPDALRLVTKGMNYKLEFSDANNQDRPNLFRDKLVDIAATSYTPTPIRRVHSDYTIPFGTGREVVLMSKSNKQKFTKPEDFKGIMIYTTIGAGWVEALEKTGANIKILPETGMLIELLKKDPTAITMVTKAIGRDGAKKNPKLKVVDGYPAFQNSQVSFAVQKGNTVLLEKLNASIQKRLADGSLKKLVVKSGYDPLKQ
jgi:polar amino acid transport system substrate-binding protein